MSKYSEISQMQRFEELLTPYVQGQLDDETRREVEQYAESSSSFAELLQFEKQIAGSVKSASTDAMEVKPSFQKLQRRIDAQQQPIPNVKLFLDRVGEFLSGRNAGLVAASLAVLAITLLTMVRTDVDTPTNDFVTLSSDGSEITLAPGRHYFRVVFVDDIETNEVARLANELQFTVESGPNRFGAYTVSIEANEVAAQSSATDWREDDRFVFVEIAHQAETP